MPAVTFDNTQNVGYIVASTSTPSRNLQFSVPPGPAGDTLVVIGVGNTATQAVSMNVIGYTTFVTATSSTGSYGELFIAYKISNGRETTTAIKTDSTTTDASLCGAVLRFKGAHRIFPLMGAAGSGSSSNTANDGIQISTGEPVSKPIGDGSILLSVLCGADGTAFLDGEQPTNQTLITKANTANARMMISFQSKPLTNAYGTQVFANTAGRRRALTFTVIPDTYAAGVKETGWGSGVSFTRTSAHVLQYDPRVSHLAKEDEEIGEVGYRSDTNTVGDGSGIEIGIYDVTNGYANAKLVGAQTVSTMALTMPSTTIQTFYPPIKLTAGRRYSTAFRTNSATNLAVSTAYLGTAVTRRSSQNGSVSLPSSWDFDSTTSDNWFDVFAPVRNNRKVHVSSYKYFSNTASGTAHSASFPLYPGASRKIILMGYAEDQSGSITQASFDGQAMTSIATSYNSPNGFSMWYYDVPSTTTAGDKVITMTTSQSTSNTTWHAWQLNRANTGLPRNVIGYSGTGVSNNVSNTVVATESSIILTTIASSSPARTYTWNNDVVTDRQELDEPQQTTATADGFQFTSGTKTITATASGTEGAKFLGIVCVDTIKSRKVKQGFVF